MEEVKSRLPKTRQTGVRPPTRQVKRFCFEVNLSNINSHRISILRFSTGAMSELVDEDEFDRLSARFISWLDQYGASISRKIQLADLRIHSEGRGGLAKEDIAEGEELFSIPRSSILTVQTTDLSGEIQAHIQDPWLGLILAMVFEHQRGPDSTWRAYFDVLPNDFDTLMYWSKEDLEQLEGSAVLNKIGKPGADKTFKERLIPIIRQYSTTFNAADVSDEHLLSLCHRMGSTIMAYAFDLEKISNQTEAEEDGWEEDSDDGDVLPKGMVPLADMLNADAHRNNSKLFYEDEKVVMKALKPIKKGEELFNDYGPLPRADLVRRYGYLTGNYAKYDVVEISLDLIKHAAKEELKLQDEDYESRIEYLDEQGALDDGYDITHDLNENGHFSEELEILVNTPIMPKADLDKLRKKEKLPKTALFNQALKLLYGILIRRRSLYPLDRDSNEEMMFDTKRSNGDPSATKHERRKSMALSVVAGEKEILKEAAEAVQLLLGETKKRGVDAFEDEAMNLQQSSKQQRT